MTQNIEEFISFSSRFVDRPYFSLPHTFLMLEVARHNRKPVVGGPMRTKKPGKKEKQRNRAYIVIPINSYLSKMDPER